MPDLRPLAQAMLLIPLGLSLVCFLGLLDRSADPRITRVLGVLTIAVSALQLALSLVMVALWSGRKSFGFSLELGGESILQIDFRIDALSLYFILLVNIIAFTASWNTWAYLKEAPVGTALRHPAFFHGSINAFHLTMLLVPMLDNLIALWVAIELTTLASAFLVGHRQTKDAWEAAWKYLIITSAGIILALLGTMLLANAMSRVPSQDQMDINIMNWSTVRNLARQIEPGSKQIGLITLSFLFILVGYGTKAGLAPMHTWLPDGHGEAPAPISALLSGVLLKSALYAILRFYTVTNAARGDASFTSAVLLGAGLLSLLLAVPFILKDNPFKRVLAYHSLEHMGIITLGIGLGGSLALFGALLHCLNHAVTKALMFLSYGNMTREYKRVLGREPSPADLTGGLHAMPKTAMLLSLGGLALVGTPPFSVFTSELIILWGALQKMLPQTRKGDEIFSQPVLLAVVCLFLLSTVLIFSGLMRHLSRFVLRRPPDPLSSGGNRRVEGWADLLPLLVLAALMLALGVYIGAPLAALLRQSVAIVQGSI